MSVVLKQLENFYKLDLNKVMIEAVKEHENTIVDFNRDQLRMGEKGDGSMVGYRSPAYLNYKRSLASYKAGNKTDLYLTGSFQDGMAGRISGNTFEVYSKDNKAPELLEKYGEQIFELNSNYMQQVHDVTTPTFFKKVHDAL